MFSLLKLSFSIFVNFSVFILFKIIFPRVGSSNNARRWRREVFPDPDGPTKATSSPSLILIFKLLNRVTCPLDCL